MDVRFLLLGDVQVQIDGRVVDVGHARQRCVLAALLTDAGRRVSTDVILERVWGERLPQRARNALSGYVSRLRQILAATDQAELTRQPGGYRLSVSDPGRVDLHRFGMLLRDARAAGHWETAVKSYDEALRLWRGEPFAALRGDWLDGLRRSLQDQRLAAVLDRNDLLLAHGAGDGLVHELASLVAEHPVDERLVAQLMLTSFRAGRQAAALHQFQLLRERLAEGYGADPGEAIRRLHQRILVGDQGLLVTTKTPPRSTSVLPVTSQSAPVPRQLPADVAAFVGRAAGLRKLSALLPEKGSSVMVVSALTGTAGVGKTALAVRWAHQVRDHFPDGQLYVNLNGYAAGSPLPPLTALAGFLTALGLPAERVPVDTDQAAALYRSLLTGRRVLVLLDNAGSAEQVRPLLPGSSGCLALVTSRDRLTGLTAREGARRLTLDVLTADEAVGLLTATLGADRAAAEPAALTALAQACAYLPLALRITAAQLQDHPTRLIADHVTQLTGHDRLTALAIDGDLETAVQTAFDLSYRALAIEPQRMFRLLGLVPGTDITVGGAAALEDLGRRQAERLLDRLAGAHLVSQPLPGRYAMHDLLRCYAADRAADVDTEADRAATVTRLLEWYLSRVDAAARLIYSQMLRLEIPAGRAGPGARPVSTGWLGDPPFEDAATALAWLDDHRPALVAAVSHAADRGPCPVAWLLADALRGYFFQTRHTVDWLQIARTGLAAAIREGDLQAQAAMEFNLGTAECGLGQYSSATAHYTAAVDLAARAGWVDGEAAITGNLGNVHADLGNLRQAADRHQAALRLYRLTGRLAGQANTLTNLGWISRQVGSLQRAVEQDREALELFGQIGSRSGQAQALENLGEAEHDLGLLEPAHRHLTAALELHRQLGNRYGEAGSLLDLAAVDRDAGALDRARETAVAAMGLAKEIQDNRTEGDALNVLGTIELRSGAPEQAARHHQQAAELARDTGTHYVEIVALAGLAASSRRQHRSAEAVELATRALRLAGNAGYRVLEADAHIILAVAQLDAGQLTQAAGTARQALAVQAGTGHRLGEARTLALLGHIAARTMAADASPWWRQAHDLFTICGAEPEAAELDLLLAEPAQYQ